MINGVSSYPIIGTFRPECFIASGTFLPNDSDDPEVADEGGTLKGLFTVVYAATGKYTVTLTPAGMAFPAPPTIILGNASKDITDTNRFEVVQIGAWDPTTRSFTIQATQDDGTTGVPAAFEVPNDPDNIISFVMLIESSTAPR